MRVQLVVQAQDGNLTVVLGTFGGMESFRLLILAYLLAWLSATRTERNAKPEAMTAAVERASEERERREMDEKSGIPSWV